MPPVTADDHRFWTPPAEPHLVPAGPDGHRPIAFRPHPQGPARRHRGRVLGLRWQGIKPDRGGPPSRWQSSIPADLVHALIHTVGLPEAELRTMTREQAIARMQRHWSGA
jgi:hypothetical protein